MVCDLESSSSCAWLQINHLFAMFVACCLTTLMHLEVHSATVLIKICTIFRRASVRTMGQ